MIRMTDGIFPTTSCAISLMTLLFPISSVTSCTNPVTISIPSLSGSLNWSYMAIPISLNPFPMIASLLSVVSYLCAASFARAVFSSHAPFAVSTALYISSFAFARLKSVLLSLISVNPISSRITVADFPFLSTSFNPFMKLATAYSPSFSKSSLNSFTDFPATFAYF